ncbi:MAG: ABC transporter ATP-binding protein [Hyphomicrobiales bacterium]|nr:ABC transporter ATP-binding protein [Hyphomicrobiales bacterium]
MAAVELSNLKKSFGSIDVIKGVDLDIQQGEFVVFVGPSGCGKSTLLRLIAGLEEITSGTLKIAGDVVNEVPPSKRGIAMVFQSYALYPHMSVYNNMAFGMKLARASKDEIDKRVTNAADMLQLTPLLTRLPKQLSGGQRQRVAIGRAIVRDPRVFLFDEPLSNLDAALRVATRIEISRLNERMVDTTMIYVTHDQVEAMTLADRIVVLNAGIIEQVGSPMELYLHPDNLFVAQFIGSPAMNVVPCTIEAGGKAAVVKPQGGEGSVHTEIAIPDSAKGSKGMVGVRPEDLGLADGRETIFTGTVDIVEKLGEVTLLYVNCGNPDEPILAKLDGIANIKRGETVSLAAAASDIHVFDEKGIAFKRKTTEH